MKKLLLPLALAAVLASPGLASADEAAAKSNGCLKCHATDKKKDGPAFKEVAKKYKGKADAEKTLVTALSTAKGHPEVKAKGDDLKGIVKWVLSL